MNVKVMRVVSFCKNKANIQVTKFLPTLKKLSINNLNIYFNIRPAQKISILKIDKK